MSNMAKKTRPLVLALCLMLCVFSSAQTVITIDDPATWTTAELSKYVGQTVVFSTPMVVCNNYYYTSSRLTISPQRIFAPTNQALPLSDEYDYLRDHNSRSELTLNGVNGYHRMGETIVNLKAQVESSTQLKAVDEPLFVGNTRDDMLAGIPSVDQKAKHNLLVCAFNLEYYLVENLGTGYGPDNSTESDKQHTKIMQALSLIAADIFGFVEIEQGQQALRKLANALTQATGRTYSFINDNGSSSGSYTKSGYVYCQETVEPVNNLRKNDTQVSHRKMMQAFRHKQSGESFIFSLNHFKAKSGAASGLNADQGDGQGTFNYTRTLEAQSVLAQYNLNKTYYEDDDLLIMGDLNAYAKEDPIRTLTDGGMTDLHRFFHADSSYSYVYHDQAGYLDHALANATLLPQITGMAAWHINSDEHDRFTYDKSTDLSMFRCSDHDPVLVGLRLSTKTEQTAPHTNNFEVLINGSNPLIINAEGGHFVIYTIDGHLLLQGQITNNAYTPDINLTQGLYIFAVYADGKAQKHKLIIP